MSTSFEKSVYVFYSMLLAAGCDAPDDSATRVRNTVADAEVTLVQAIDAAVLARPSSRSRRRPRSTRSACSPTRT
jgi:hypothetical protein